MPQDSTALARPAGGLWSRVIAGAVDVFAALRAPPSSPVMAAAGSVVAQEYDAERALSAAGANAWVRAAIERKIAALAGVPLYAYRIEGDREIILSPTPGVGVYDPRAARALSMLRQPSAQVSGIRYRRQVYADLELAGNAYTLIAGDELIRLHPDAMRADVDQYGRIIQWRWQPPGGSEVRILPAAVLHVAGISWRNDHTMPLGEAPIRAIDAAISTSASARKMADNAAKKGRYDAVISAKAAVSPHALREIADRWEADAKAGRSVFALSDAFEVTTLGISPKDLEYRSIEEIARNEISAILGVPGTVMGTLAAAYGQARQEARTFYELLRLGPAALFSDEWSRLTGDPSVRIAHDFSAVESLQAANLDRLEQARMLVADMGATPSAALSYVGLEDAPYGVPDPANASGPRPVEGAVTQPQEARAVAAIARALAAAARRAESGGTSLDAERVRWAATLEDEGLSADQAEAAAAKIAANLARSVGVARADAAARGHDLQGVASLPAFGRDSALRIAYDIGAMGEK